MWIESHTNLARHPKTRRLMKLLGWSLPDTIGNLHLLWWWALEYAPTGDLTPFAPDQLTADLDLGNATPAEFIEAMIAAGFLDKSESSVIRIHDWPEYTAKSLRPKFRRNPDRWHQVLRSYGLPIPQQRQRRAISHPLPASQFRSARAEHDPNLVVPPRRDEPEHQPEPETFSPHTSSGDVGAADTERRPANIHTHLASSQFNGIGAAPSSNDTAAPPIKFPKSLASQPGLTDIWWPKFVEMYKLKGCPLNDSEQRKVLERLERLNGNRRTTALQMLKKAVTDYEASISALPLLPASSHRPVRTGHDPQLAVPPRRDFADST